MDLYAYTRITTLEPVLKEVGVEIHRLRGLRLMKFEKEYTEEDINRLIKNLKLNAVVRWLKQHSWNCWCSTKDDKEHKAFIYGYEQDSFTGERDETKSIVDFDFSKIHGKDRKVLKLKFKHIENAVIKQCGLFNKFAGKDVLYVHTRSGGNNRGWCKMDEIAKHPLYLGDADSCFDSTYCDIYFDISNIDIDSLNLELEPEE